MSNREQNLSPLQRHSRNGTTDKDAGCGTSILGCCTSILLSLGTTFSVCFVTSHLFYDYYMRYSFTGLTKQLEGEFTVLCIWLLGFPIIFVIALIIWLVTVRRSSSLKNAVTNWLASLIVGLGVSHTIVLVAFNFWEANTDPAFLNSQVSIILLVVPLCSLVIYAIFLAK